MHRRLAILLCTIVLGCSASGEAEAGNSCSDRADRMGKEMSARAERMSVLSDDPGAPPLPVAKGQTTVTHGLVIQIDADGKVRFEGRDLGSDRAALRQRIVATREMAKRHPRHHAELTATYLWADKSARVSALIEVAQAVPTDVPLRLVVADATTAPTPAPHLQADDGVKQLMREIAAGRDSGDRAVAIAKALQGAIAPCVPLVRAYGDVAGVANKGAFMAREVPSALKQCKCQMANVDLVEYGMLATFGAYERTLGWLALPSATELATRRTASVDELAAVLARR